MPASRRRLMGFERLTVRRIVTGALLLAATAWAMPPAEAQESSAEAINIDPGVNGRHLLDAVALGQSALASLQGPRAVDELPAIHKKIDLMYRTVRLALFGMREKKKRTKFDDPLQTYQLGQTGRAWDIIRGAVDRYFDSLPPEVYIAKAIPELQEAIKILRPIAVVMQ